MVWEGALHRRSHVDRCWVWGKQLCLLPKVFTGGDMQGLFQTATDSNLLLIKTVQKTFGNGLRDPALFMRTV